MGGEVEGNEDAPFAGAREAVSAEVICLSAGWGLAACGDSAASVRGGDCDFLSLCMQTTPDQVIVDFHLLPGKPPTGQESE